MRFIGFVLAAIALTINSGMLVWISINAYQDFLLWVTVFDYPYTKYITDFGPAIGILLGYFILNIISAYKWLTR